MNARVLNIHRDGLKLHVEERGEGGPALVFLHYWGGTGRTWRGVVDRLAGRFRCLTVDLRGWGQSDRTAQDYSLFTQADDVAHIIAALGLESYVLVGHSMGGKIAQIVAGHPPPGLKGIVLVAPAPPSPRRVPQAQQRQMLDSYQNPEGVEGALQILTRRRLSDAQREQVTVDTVGGAPGAKDAWVNDGMPLDITAQAGEISVPVCVIVGSADQVEPESLLRQEFRAWVPQARFEVLEGVGHLSPLEAPDSVAEAIWDFLSR